MLIALPSTIVEHEGEKYVIEPLPEVRDVTAEMAHGKPAELSHLIVNSSLKDPVYVVATAEGHGAVSFGFAYQVGETGLMMNIDDENEFQFLSELVFAALEQQDV